MKGYSKMNKKPNINKIINEMGYTYDEMQAFWDELKETNSKVKMLSNSGVNWDDMSANVIRELPTQKQRDLAKKKEQKKKVEQAEKEEESFEEYILKKIDKNESLTERELKTLVFDYEIEKEYGENRRWTRSVNTIISLLDRTFEICWEQGLTECQENEFYNQPVEVEKHTYEKTITVTEWRKKEQ